MTTDIIIPLGDLIEHAQARPWAVTLHESAAGWQAFQEMSGSRIPLLDCETYPTPAEAAEALATRYDIPDGYPRMDWEEMGTGFATQLSVPRQKDRDPVAYATKYFGGYIILDLAPRLRVIVYVDDGATGSALVAARGAAAWLALALPTTPVRVRRGGKGEAEVVVGVLS